MQLLDVWKNTLTLYKPQNLKLFFLVTLKSVVETYKIMVGTFWPLVVGCSAIMIISGILLKPWIPIVLVSGEIPDSVSLLTVLLLMLAVIAPFLSFYYLYFLMYLIARPSVDLKDYAYLKQYCRYFFWFLIVFVLPFEFPIKAIVLFLGFFTDYFTFFYLDSHGGFYTLFPSIKRAGKMLLYTLPVVIPLIVLSYAYAFGIKFLFWFGSVEESIKAFLACPLAMSLFVFIDIFIVQPISICVMSNLYTKYLHENFELYFEQKG
ncbi:MAG: hypothetical protein NTX86_04745 [Candidatus Dependentiae bacterium]|nr:hypothetical protein [Candidatus Dependentiae bacterium]